MNSKIRTLFSQTSLYSLGGISIRLISFFLLPLYLKHLTPASYGIVEIINTLTNILIIICGFGMSSAVFREYYKEDNEKYKKGIIGTAFIFLFVINVIIISIFFLCRKFLSGLLLGIENQEYVFILVILNIFFLTLLNINYSILRAKEEPLKFSIFNVIRTTIYAGVNIYLVAILHRGYVGVIEGIFISTLATFLLSSPYLIKNIALHYSASAMKSMLKFGVPIIFSGLSFWILSLTDRYMLKFLIPESIALTQVGIYSLGAKLSSVGKLILVQPFSLSWGVAMFKNEKEHDARKFYANAFKYYILIAAIFYITTVLFANNVIRVLSSNPTYYSAYKVVPFLTGSAMFSGLFMLLSVGLTLTYKNKYSSFATMLAAIANIILNFILIPKFMIIGAAFASIISTSLMVILQYYFAQKFYRISYNLKYFFIMLVSCIFITIFITHVSLSIFYKIIIFVLMISIFIKISGIDIKSICKVRNL